MIIRLEIVRKNLFHNILVRVFSGNVEGYDIIGIEIMRSDVSDISHVLLPCDQITYRISRFVKESETGLGMTLTIR